MAMTLSELVDLREASTAQENKPGADPRHFAYHRGSANAVRSVLFVVAAGEVVTQHEIEDQLNRLKARTRQPWNRQYAAYWDGAVATLEHIRDRWTVDSA